MKTWMRRLAGLFGLGVLAAQGMVAHEVFVDSFGDAAQWPEVMNYENKLVLTVGAELASGGTGLRVSGAHLPDCDTAWNVRTARRPLTVKGAYFRLSFRLSSQTAVMVGKGDSQTWWTALRWFAADGEPLEPSRLSWSVSAGGPHEVVCLGRVPSGAAAYQLQLGYDLPNIVKGNVVTVSDVRLAVLDGVARGASDRGTGDLHPRVKLLTPSPTRDAHVPVRLALDGEFDIDWSRVKVVLDGADATERFVRTDGALVLTPSEPWTPGLHHVDVTAVDVFGQRTEAHKAFFLGEAPQTPRVTLRDDGMTLIDGVPFFPIGIYGVMRREFNAYDFDRACADLRQGGFNFVHSYASPHEDDFLDNAWKHGLRVWNVARMPDARFIDVERHHPAILAWYLGDDTSANTTVQQLEDYQDAVKAVDPTRLTTQADGVASDRAVSNYAPFVAGTDNFLAEIYPVHADTAAERSNCVAKVIRDMRRVRADVAASGLRAPRSCWPIIQYFKGWGWERFPHRDELFAMSFAALVHGAHGITWYTYGGTVEPEKKKFNYGITTSYARWTNMTNLATRISSLAPVLVERTPPDPPAVAVVKGPAEDPLGQPSVSCLLKRHANKFYVLAVNGTCAPVEATIALGGRCAAAGEVLWEDRRVTLADGVLADAFAPFAVHVYVFELSGECSR